MPESVDREKGVVSFYASEFSTYALLTSETVTVTFNANGGSAVDPQTVKFGERASKPADPTRAGHTFAGWFADEALAQPFDFATPLESSITLYAKWTAVQGGSGGTEADKPEAKPLPAAGKKLASTGDATAPLAAGAAALALAAGAAIAVTARRKRG